MDPDTARPAQEQHVERDAPRCKEGRDVLDDRVASGQS